MGVIQLMAAKSSSSFGAFATSYIDYNLCILKQQQLSWMSLTAMRSKMLSSLPKRNAAPCHQRDTEFIKLMKTAPYLTVEYFLANTKNKMALVSFIGEFILNSYCVKQPLFDGYILFLAGAFCNPEVVKKIVRNQAIDCVSLF